MSKPNVEENTLGIRVGREGRHRQEQQRRARRSGFQRPERTVKTARANQNGLGGRHLGIGLSLCGGVIALFLLFRFIVQWDDNPSSLLVLAAWIVLAAVAAIALTLMQRRLARIPRWVFPVVLVLAALVVVLDLAGCAYVRGDGVFPTAAPAVGALLTSVVTVRETREVMAATVVLGLVMTTGAVFALRTDPLTFAPSILTIGLGVVPPLLGVAIVRSFRRMVQLELDLVLVQSTVSQPRFAVGMLASEQLARLDLDAERLLDDVAEGRTELPLSTDMANTAASLATQLRLHLIEGRTETWLHHAVTESEFLAPSVTVTDPSGLAGLLAPEQRDALLLTIWLLTGDASRTVSLTLGPITVAPGMRPDRTIRFPIELSTTGVPRRRVDPETWQAIRVVGRHVDSNRGGSIRVEIDCSVDNPADA